MPMKILISAISHNTVGKPLWPAWCGQIRTTPTGDSKRTLLFTLSAAFWFESMCKQGASRRGS